MVFLKEDGSLDIERISKLPIEEHMNMLGDLTSQQMKEYLSSIPINESNNCPRNIIVDYTMEDEIKRGTGVDIDEYLKKWKNELDNI